LHSNLNQSNYWLPGRVEPPQPRARCASAAAALQPQLQPATKIDRVAGVG